MKVHPAGYVIIVAIVLFVAVVLLIVNIIFPQQAIAHYILYSIGFVFLILVVRFFRKPERNTLIDKNNIYSSADGKVVAIEEVVESEYTNGKRIQVSVFMTLVDAHVNWFPVSGVIKYIHHKSGGNYPAYSPKSSEENERNTIAIENEDGRIIVIRQIAGVLARRIVCKTNTNDLVKQGQEIGIILFGSRVDLFLPLEARLKVKLHQKVKGGSTLIATLDQ